MLKNLIPKTIRQKIMTVTILITFMIMVITITVGFLVFQSFLKKNQIQSTEFSLQVVTNNIAADMKDILYFSSWCGSSNNIQSYLEALSDQPRLPVAARDSQNLRPTALSAYDRLKEEFLNTRARKYINRVIVSTNDQHNFLQMIATTNHSSPNAAVVIKETGFFKQLLDAPGYLWLGLVDDPFTQVNPTQIIPIIRPVSNKFNSETIGWTYVELSPRLFTDYLASYPLSQDSAMYLTMGEHLYTLYPPVGDTLTGYPAEYKITSDGWQESDTPFTVSKDITNETTLSPQTRVLSVTMADGSARTLVRSPIGEMDGWYLSLILSEQQLNSQKHIYSLLLFGICLSIISLGILLTFSLNKIISPPILQLRHKIDAIASGDFSKDQSIEWEHELGQVGRGINNMSDNIVTLMDKRVADEQQKKDLEYQILQSQINPHFLYNTLNSIKWMATIQNADGIADMTTSLARLLKNVSKSTSSMVTLREELDLVRDYFLIQQYRYGGSITIGYEIQSEELYDCRIHRFTLQPIIENALFHGIEPKGTTGHITISAQALPSDRGNDLKISITDNGIGMTPEMIDRVLHEDLADESKTDFFKHVGISNVNRRIQHDYGPCYGISITSEPGVYTTMTILIQCPPPEGR